MILTCGGISVTTGPSGTFQLDSIVAGRQTLTASKIGYEPYTQTITIVANTAIQHSILLVSTAPTTSIVSGIVTREDNQQPVSSAKVVIGNDSTYTDGTGFYQLSSVPLGFQNIRVDALAYLPFAGQVNVNGTSMTYNIVLEKGTLISDTLLPNNSIWKVDYSPYVIKDSLNVSIDRLSLEPGVVVRFGNFSNLSVISNVNFAGTSNAPIIFQDPEFRPNSNIKLSADNIILTNIRFYGTNLLINQTAAVSTTIRNCQFNNSRLQAQGSDPGTLNMGIFNAEYVIAKIGITVFGYQNAILKHMIVDSSSYKQSRILVAGNETALLEDIRVSGASEYQGGITLYNTRNQISSITIINSTITGIFKDQAIRIGHSGYKQNVSISGCEILNNNIGLEKVGHDSVETISISESNFIGNNQEAYYYVDTIASCYLAGNSGYSLSEVDTSTTSGGTQHYGGKVILNPRSTLKE